MQSFAPEFGAENFFVSSGHASGFLDWSELNYQPEQAAKTSMRQSRTPPKPENFSLRIRLCSLATPKLTALCLTGSASRGPTNIAFAFNGLREIMIRNMCQDPALDVFFQTRRQG
jgi:hypothetical protein